MSTMETTTLAGVIRARRKDIREQAECEGCGTTLAECKRLAAENTDPTAPAWFGCCAMGADLGPCNHLPNARLLSGLLKEIEDGTVRTVEEVRAARAEKTKQAADRRTAATPPGQSRPLSYAERFDQGEWWLTKDTGWIRIVDMAPSHRANTVRFLERRAAHIAEKACWSQAISLGDAPDDVQNDLMREDDTRRADPLRWLRGTPLLKALSAGMQVDAATGDLTAEQARKDSGTLADHPFAGFGSTCPQPIEGVGDDFIRCGRPAEEHASSWAVADHYPDGDA